MSAATITLLFLLFAVVMFVFEKIPLGVTSMIVCVGLVVAGVLDVKTAFAGFIDSNVILFVAMFIVGGALFETGMANKIGGIVTHFAKSERSLIVAIMAIVGLMSGVLSNTGTAAVLIPVVIGIAAKSGYEFVQKSGVRVIVGKGGMGPNTERACKEFGAIHCVFPAGNAVVAATEVEEIVEAQWRDLGMPETLWHCHVNEFGPLIVSIDAEGRNLFEENKVIFNERKEKAIEEICKHVGFIK